MKIRSLMARGAVITTLAAGGVGLTSVTAQAACNYTYLLYQRNYYQGQADWNEANYNYFDRIGDRANASFYYDEWQMDLSAVQNYNSRLNMCNAREP